MGSENFIREGRELLAALGLGEYEARACSDYLNRNEFEMSSPLFPPQANGSPLP